jgi:hypothetical protein
VRPPTPVPVTHRKNEALYKKGLRELYINNGLLSSF